MMVESNTPNMLLESKLLFETLKQHRKILESHLLPAEKVNLLSSNFDQIFDRVKNFCDSLAIHSKELGDIV